MMIDAAALLVQMKGMSLAWMREALETYAEWNGPCHDDPCPGDDTCNCSQKWVNDGVNSACRFLKALEEQALKEQGAADDRP